MDSNGGGARTQRRLPTKTRSGIISLPGQQQAPSQPSEPGIPAGLAPCSPQVDALQDPNSSTGAAMEAGSLHNTKQGVLLLSSGQLNSPRHESATTATELQTQAMQAVTLPSQLQGQQLANHETAQQPEVDGNGQNSSMGGMPAPGLTATDIPPKPASLGVPSRPGKVVTGPLNSSTAPQVVSLPVKRRGSYQSLKKHTNSAKSLNSEDRPSLLALVRKSTHWEKYGTILVLYCAANSQAASDGGVLQMMMAEGYDTHVVDNQADAISTFTCQEVFPDIVLVDADHTYNTIQLIKHLQTQHSTAAVIVIGTDGCKPGAISLLQAGATDYVRKPVEPDELIARIERHVQRQHAIKMELEKTLESIKAMVSQLGPASVLGTALLGGSSRGNSCGSGMGRGRLGAVAETDFEDQMAELCEENSRLGAKLAAVETQLAKAQVENRVLEERLARIDSNNDGYGRRLVQVEHQSATLLHKVTELQKCITLRERGSPTWSAPASDNRQDTSDQQLHTLDRLS